MGLGIWGRGGGLESGALGSGGWDRGIGVGGSGLGGLESMVVVVGWSWGVWGREGWSRGGWGWGRGVVIGLKLP